MPLIGMVGRKSWAVRLLNLSIHLVLLVGATTMIYPFLIMISGSVKCSVDIKSMSVVPEYFRNRDMLFQKYAAARNNDTLQRAQNRYEHWCSSFEALASPPAAPPQVLADWRAFLGEFAQDSKKGGHPSGLDHRTWCIAERSAGGLIPRNQRAFIQWIQERFHRNLGAANKALGLSITSWDQLQLPAEDFLDRQAALNPREAMYPYYLEFKNSRPEWQRSYLNSDGEFINFLRQGYQNRLQALNQALGMDIRSWREIRLTETMPSGKLGAEWATYVRTRLHLFFIRVAPEGEASYQEYLRIRFGNDLQRINRAYGTQYADFGKIPLPAGPMPDFGPSTPDWSAFISKAVAPEHLRVVTLSTLYRSFLRKRYGDIARLNQAHGRFLAGFSEVALPRMRPDDNLALREDWDAFTREAAKPEWLTLEAPGYNDFLSALAKRYPLAGAAGEKEIAFRIDFPALNQAWGTDFHATKAGASLPQLGMPPESKPAWRKAWVEFITTTADRRFVHLETGRDAAGAQQAWAGFLQRKYGNVAALNVSHRLAYDSFDVVGMPLLQADYADFTAHESEIFWEFVTRNYRMVIDALLLDGRAALNTVIYCLLSVLASLIVNPLAAYALSRYKPPSTYKILLFLMLPIAFPPMVLGIPNFLLMKQLGLLNTFGALILPALANGYSIFLLKGFFDSLPKELFESASIDGASEWVMFWNITMTLSKPILAVIALGAFAHAYGNFMLAFITCQDPEMWTIMVNLYQLQSRSSQAVQFASLVVAAIPTFLIFAFCQKIILRGIVVPTEK